MLVSLNLTKEGCPPEFFNFNTFSLVATTSSLVPGLTVPIPTQPLKNPTAEQTAVLP